MTEPIIKKRKIEVLGMKDQLNADKITDSLKKKEGMITVVADIQKGYLRVEYDLRKINFELVEKSIEEAGLGLSKKRTERLKRGMAKFTEQNELDNLTAKPTSCCSDPKETGSKLYK